MYRYASGLITSLVFVVVLCSPSLGEQGSSSSGAEPQDNGARVEGGTEELELNGSYFKGYLTDTRDILTSPARWDNKDWTKAAVVLGLAGGLYAYDSDIQQWAQSNRSDASDDIADKADYLGNGRYTLPPFVALYLYGRYADDSRAKRTALLGLESFIVTGVFTQALKYGFHRHRPNSDDPYNTFDGPAFRSDDLSFASGHTSSAFSLATVVATEYKDIKFVPPVAYALATLAGLSRINNDAHWSSDVFVGAALGYFTSKAIIKLHEDDADTSISLMPVIDSDAAYVSFTYRF